MSESTPSSAPALHGRSLRTAVLGYGVGGGLFHCPLLESSPAFDLAAIVTADPGRVATAAAAYPAARILASAEQVWADVERYDLVVISTPNETHVPLAREAIKRGIAVVLDKPVAPSAASARGLVAEARAAGIPLTVFQNRRWDGDFLTLRALLDRGAFGVVHQFESRFSWFAPSPSPSWKTRTTVADGGGALYDLGPHLIDQAIQLFGPVSDWYAECDTRRSGGAADDDTFVALTHATGVRSRLWMSSVTPLSGPRFRVVGSAAGYTKSHLDPQEAQAVAGIAPSDPRFGIEDEGRWGLLGTDDATVAVPTQRGNHAAFYALLGAALRGEGPLPVAPEEPIAVLDLIEAIHGGN